MKNAWLYCVSVTACLLASGCIVGMPKVEDCVVGSANGICIDERKPKDEQIYLRPFSEMVNYHCTSPYDLNTLEEWARRRKQK